MRVIQSPRFVLLCVLLVGCPDNEDGPSSTGDANDTAGQSDVVALQDIIEQGVDALTMYSRSIPYVELGSVSPLVRASVFPFCSQNGTAQVLLGQNAPSLSNGHGHREENRWRFCDENMTTRVVELTDLISTSTIL